MDDVIFSCKICDGAIFKTFSGAISTSGVLFALTITKDRIIFNQISGSDGSLIKAEYYKRELLDWINTFPEDISFSFDSKELCSATNVVKRSENIYLYMTGYDQFCVSIFHRAVSSENVAFVKCERLESPIVINENAGYPPEDEPNVVEQCSTITVGCASIIKQKCTMIKLLGRKSRLVIGGLSGSSIQSVISYGNEPASEAITPALLKIRLEGRGRIFMRDPYEIVFTPISNGVLQLISKACRLTHNAIMKVYFARNSPVKIVFPIFLYGKLTLYIPVK